MRPRWFVLVIVVLFVNLGYAQEPKDSPTRDSQALLVLQQAVQAAGGLQQLDALQSYLGSGHVTSYLTEKGTEGEVTIKWRSRCDVRFDAHMSNGVDEEWMIRGWSGFMKGVDKKLRPLKYQELVNLQSFCPPTVMLASALQDSTVSVSLLKPSDGQEQQAFGLRVRKGAPHAGPADILTQLRTRDFYVDAKTFRVLCVEDRSYPRDQITDGVKRIVTFSDYREVGGTIVPFAMLEQVASENQDKTHPSEERRLTEIHLDRISINAPLSDKDFAP